MMKQNLLLFTFLLISFSGFSQKLMSVKWTSTTVSVGAKADEGEIVIRSCYELSFESKTKEKDKKTNPLKIENEGEFKLYYFMFSTLPKYNDRVLKISCKGYPTLELPISLAAYEAKNYYVWDKKGLCGLTSFESALNEGDHLFEQGQYDQARDKYFDAMDAVEVDGVSDEEQKELSARLEKVVQCVELKEDAEQLFFNEKWAEAKGKYEALFTLNAKDSHTRDRINACQENYEKMPRTITGMVKDADGKPIPGAVVMAIEYDLKGKALPANKCVRASTDNSGKYELKIQNKVKQVKCWEGMRRPIISDIKDDKIDFTLK